MDNRFRLYIGLMRDSTWFNYAIVDEIKGGSLAVLDGVNKTGSARLFNLVKGAVKKLYSEDGIEYELQDKDYSDIRVDDCWKIALECMRQFNTGKKMDFEEYFYCDVCSRPGRERYTKVEESWHELIEQGFIDEHFVDTEECGWWTELPVGVEIEGNRVVRGGNYKKIKQEPLTLGEIIKIQSMPELIESESSMIYAIWDAQIKEIEGMSQRDLNILVKRNPKDSFSKKYIIHQSDIDSMSASDIPIGLDGRYRSVQCQNCQSEIGGYLDFTNFFEFLFPKPSSRNGGMDI